MDQCLRVVTTCTDRKKLPASEMLCARSLPKSVISRLAFTWRERIQSCTEERPSAEVYAGRSFREAQVAASVAGVELKIISAGLGLISASDVIPAYSLTLVRGATDCIVSRVDGRFDAAMWWQLMQRGHVDPLAALIRQDQHMTLAIGLTRAYIALVLADLMKLDSVERSRLRIVGMSIADALPPPLRTCVLPYDDRLDGPQSAFRGTRSDFASRALRHFTTKVWPAACGASLEIHKEGVATSLQDWEHAPRFSRQLKSDREIIDVIVGSMNETGGQVGRALRYLRDIKGIACEQGRFKDLFKQALVEADAQ